MELTVNIERCECLCSYETHLDLFAVAMDEAQSGELREQPRFR